MTHGDVGGNAFGNYGHGDDHKGIPEQEQVPVGEVNKSEMIKPGGANEPDCPTDPRKCSRTHP